MCKSGSHAVMEKKKPLAKLLFYTYQLSVCQYYEYMRRVLLRSDMYIWEHSITSPLVTLQYQRWVALACVYVCVAEYENSRHWAEDSLCFVTLIQAASLGFQWHQQTSAVISLRSICPCVPHEFFLHQCSGFLSVPALAVVDISFQIKPFISSIIIWNCSAQ